MLTNLASNAAEVPEESSFHFGGVDMHYETLGVGSTTLVCIHGFGLSLETWKDISPFLEGHVRLLLVDLKGCGRSSKPDDGKYSPREQAAMVAAFIQWLPETSVAIFGHSYGGLVAILACLILNDAGKMHRVSRLILEGPVAYPQPLPLHIAVLRIPVINRLVFFLTTAQWRTRFALRRSYADPSRLTSDNVLRQCKGLESDAATSLIAMAQQLTSMDPATISLRLIELTMPSLILSGDRDRIIPEGSAARLHRDLPPSDLKTIPDCGHIPHSERPDLTARCILDFLFSDPNAQRRPS